MQVLEKESQVELGVLFRKVDNTIAEKFGHPRTHQRYHAGPIERALKAIGLSVDPTRPAKQQVLPRLPHYSCDTGAPVHVLEKGPGTMTAHICGLCMRLEECTGMQAFEAAPKLQKMCPIVHVTILLPHIYGLTSLRCLSS